MFYTNGQSDCMYWTLYGTQNLWNKFNIMLWPIMKTSATSKIHFAPQNLTLSEGKSLRAWFRTLTCHKNILAASASVSLSPPGSWLSPSHVVCHRLPHPDRCVRVVPDAGGLWGAWGRKHYGSDLQHQSHRWWSRSMDKVLEGAQYLWGAAAQPAKTTHKETVPSEQWSKENWAAKAADF